MTLAYYGYAQDPRQRLLDMLGSSVQRVGVDTETVSVIDHTLLGLGVAFSGEDAFYAEPDEPEFPLLLAMLKRKDISKVYHNAPFDLRVLRKYDLDVDGVDDTALMARLNMEVSAVLEDVSFYAKYKHFGDRQTQSMVHLMHDYKVKKPTDLPPDVLAEKCCKDAQATLLLYEYYMSKLNMQYYEEMRQIIGKLERISRQGIKLDHDRIVELNKIYTQEENYLRALCSSFGFSPSKNFEVGYVMSQRGNFLPFTQSKRQLATDNANMRKLNDPLASAVLQWRRANKMLGTYIRPWLNADRAYTTLRMEAATGRLNSTNAGKLEPDRNLQNIPKNADVGREITIRSAFIPDNRVFTKADKSQLELRILAHRSGDKRMKAVLDADGDFHADTIDGMKDRGIKVTRTEAKNFNYGISYGADEYTLAENLGTSDIARTKMQLDAWYETYPEAAEYLIGQEEFGLKHGYVTTSGGRNMRVPLDMGEKHARNCSRNYPIQGTAAEDMFMLMNHPDVAKHIDITRLQVHDELIFDGRIELPGMELNPERSFKEGRAVYEVKGELAHLSGFYAPLDVVYAERWG